MALSERAKRLLDDGKAEYSLVPHREAFTAQGVAAASHVSGWQLAKVLIVCDEDKRPLMAVLPASCRLDLNALARVADKPKLDLMPEQDVHRLCPDCETGAMPPFGALYDMPLYVDACFPRAQELVFQAGNHHEVVRMSYREYERLAKPVVADFCAH